MSVIVRPVHTTDQLEQYVKFGIDLYRDNDCYVPPLVSDDVHTLSPHVNPAFDFCEAQSFMAWRNGEPVGTITAIINRAANEKFCRNDLRFGFMDFIDDAEVVDALFAAVEEWGRSRGMTEMIGPMGFSDMDHEGMLIDGFDEKGTMATIYNYPYYPAHMERLGFKKDVDWVEYRIKVPEQIPEKYARIADIAARKFGLRTIKYKSRKKIKKDYGRAIFELINRSYSDLYGYVSLTDRQIDYYIDQYIGILRLDDVSLVVDSADRLVAVGISMPSMSDALRRSRGRLFPFGWWHLLRALRGGTDTVDLLLVAVAPEYRAKGVNAMLFADLIPAFNASGYTEAESNVELEGNESVQKQWEYFERRQHRRRRAFRRSIPPETPVTA
ncbi:MAG: N-acetyltransferase [Muribaculaceae bacterium]|nr:N-acetyltransferase [Muribaculaceae bacterium]